MRSTLHKLVQIIKNRLVKITLWLIAAIMLLFIVATVALQTSYVQTKVAHKLSVFLTKKTGFPTTIGRVSIDWMDQIRLNGVEVIEPDGHHMVYIDQAIINYKLKSLARDNTIHFDELLLDSASLFLTKIHINDSTTDLNLNILIRRIKQLISKSETSPKLIEVGNIKLNKSTFRYHHPDKDSLHDRFDYQHFTLVDIEAGLYGFTQRRDTVSFDLVHLSMTDQATKLKMTDLQTKFSVSQKQMAFEKLTAEFGKSRITDKVIFTYPTLKSMNDFNNLVSIDAQFKSSILTTDDLTLFAPDVRKHHQRMIISGNFKGKIKGFNFKNFDIELNSGNKLQGKIAMYGLPNLEETFIDLSVKRASIDADALKTMFKPKTSRFISSFGRTQLNGKFIGYMNDFVANGVFNTQMGKIVSDINLKVPEEISDSRYSGHLEMSDFDLGRFTNQRLFQKVTLNGEINGKGLSFSTADFKLVGEIKKIGIYNYDYTNILTDAHFSEEFFEGKADIDDPNLKFSLEGFIDLRDGKDNYKATLDLKKALLKPLNLSGHNVSITTEATIDAKGLKIDSISGEVNFRNTFVEHDGKSLVLDDLFLKTTHEDNNRILIISSTLFDANIEGTYHYTTAIKSLLTLLNEYKLHLDNDQSALSAYYEKKETNSGNQFLINYDINLKQFTPVIELFKEDLKISNNTKLNGIYSAGYTSVLSINSGIDTLAYTGNNFYNLDIDISASKIADSTNVSAMGFISSSSQKLTNDIATENLMIESIWDDDHIDFQFNIEQKKYNNSMNITGVVDFLSDTTIFHFDESSIGLFENHWKFDQSNRISIVKKDIQFTNFKLFNDRQSISVNNTLSANGSKQAVVNFDNIDIGIMNPIITKKIQGSLNGFMEIKNYSQTPEIESEITVDDFYLDNFLLGDFYTKTQWKENDQSFKIRAFLDREGRRTVNINGFYHPQDRLSPLDLRANFDRTSVSVLETFFNKLFSDIDGQATGIFKITGKPESPIINGMGFVEQGKIKVNYLNTAYTFEGNFGFTEDKIRFINIRLNDTLGSEASLTGEISHEGFKNMVIDVQSELTMFQILNTSSADNKLFYGEGYATGHVTFKGPVRNMTINAFAKSTKGTKIYIPIGDTDNIEKEDYINFTNFTSETATTTSVDISESIDLKGLTMNFDLDITPDAYCELLFDIKSGDIIRGRGNGQINLKIDTHGKFNMFGDYILDQGGYNFTLYNVINKEFNLLPESKISWYGDPYQGILNMSATYSQITPLSPLVDTPFQRIAAIKRGYPVDVKLMLEGPLLSPTINFDINIRDYPATVTGSGGSPVHLEDIVTRLENRISTDEYELNRQVFSLIVLRKFSPPQSFNTTGSIGSSVSEFISNQLSYWVSQVDENLEVDLDLGKLDDEAFNTFQLRLSYTFLDGRLQVTREGGGSTQNKNRDVLGIVGDWTVEYMLTADGKVRAKIYERTNYNALTNSSLNGTATITTGFSLLHTQDFNTIGELLTNERKKQRKKQQQAELIKEKALKNEE